MKTLLFKNPFAGKLFTICCLPLVLLMPRYANGQSVSFGIDFGQPQSNNGPCVGKGGCEDVFDINTSTGNYASSASAVTVTFQVPVANIIAPPPQQSYTDTVNTAQENIDSIVPVNNTDTPAVNANVVIMSFSLSELENKQPDQVAYFTDSSHTYQFGGQYSLTDPIFTPLQLLPNAYIDSTDSTNVTINGDIVSVTIYYSYSAGKGTTPSAALATSSKNTLYPNPATDMIMLHVNGDENADHYNITNLVGQVISGGTITGASNNIDISNLPAGMYLINVLTENTRMETLKFVKQ